MRTFCFHVFHIGLSLIGLFQHDGNSCHEEAALLHGQLNECNTREAQYKKELEELRESNKKLSHDFHQGNLTVSQLQAHNQGLQKQLEELRMACPDSMAVDDNFTTTDAICGHTSQHSPRDPTTNYGQSANDVIGKRQSEKQKLSNYNHIFHQVSDSNITNIIAQVQVILDHPTPCNMGPQCMVNQIRANRKVLGANLPVLFVLNLVRPMRTCICFRVQTRDCIGYLAGRPI